MYICIWLQPLLLLHLCFRLGITMPMSLANTQSLSKCRKLRELLLCTLPQQHLEKGSFDQVRPLTRNSLVGLDVRTHLLKQHPVVSTAIISA
jgi:hypothetical protein